MRTLESINQNNTTTSSIMSASSKAAERDPLLPYARQFGSINDEDENDDGKRFERRGASSDDVENGRKKTFFLFDHGGAHSSRDASSRAKIHASFLYVLLACVLFFSGAMVGSSSSPLSKMILMSKEDGVASAKGQPREINTIGSGRWRRSKTLPVRRLYHQR